MLTFPFRVLKSRWGIAIDLSVEQAGVDGAIYRNVHRGCAEELIALTRRG